MTPEDLLGKRLPIAVAERTLALAASALKAGDRRLASSRAITAVIQASVASARMSPKSEDMLRARFIVLSARSLIQKLVIARAASLGLWRSA